MVVFMMDNVFSGFSVDDIDVVKEFYGMIFGFDVEVNVMGFFDLKLLCGGLIFVYVKLNYILVSFMILNFLVVDVDVVVDEFND